MKEKEEIVKYILFDKRNFSVYIIPFISFLSIFIGILMFIDTPTNEIIFEIISLFCIVFMLFFLWFYIYKTRKISAIITNQNLYIHHRILPINTITKVEANKFCNELIISFKTDTKIRKMSLPFIKEQETILNLLNSLIKPDIR